MNTAPLTLWRHARLATFAAPTGWGLVDDGALLTQGAHIRWLGPDAQLSGVMLQVQASAENNLRGALVTPGLVDCHTHLVYGGDRAAEFELRLQGASYEDIARAGGGIRSTVAATRAASDDTLFTSAAARARTLMREGVTTLEIKSGYGLSAEHEARCLAVARRIGAELPLTVCTTSLAAHALPPEFAGRADDYISAACTWLAAQQQAGLVDAVDAFCDTIGFTPAQTERIFQTAQRLGLPVKLHAEQLSDQNGAALAARYGALSCDHLEHLSASGITALQAAGTVAVLLPGAYYYLRDTQLPPVQALREAGVPMAIATDHNPGSSPCLSLLLMLNMACTLFRLTPEEAWRGVTVNAARALGLKDRGTLASGQRADFAVWDAEHPRELAYRFGHNPCRAVVRAGLTFNHLMNPTYTLQSGHTPLLISMPHVGTQLPADQMHRYTARALEVEDTDWFLDRLYAFAGDLGATLLVPRYSRYLVDLNRAPDNVPMYPGQNNTELCPTRHFTGDAVYLPGQAPDTAEIERRVASYWQPYHHALQAQAQRLKAQHGHVVVFDAHSIKSTLPWLFEGTLPHMNVGTAGGASCAPALQQAVANVFAGQNDYSHVLNGRFKGGYITRQYGQPSGGVHTVQLEMAWSAYMDEAPPYRWHAQRAAAVSPLLKSLVQALLEWKPGV